LTEIGSSPGNDKVLGADPWSGAPRRELVDDGKLFSLVVGEVGLMRTQVSGREFSATDRSLLECRRVDLAPGFAGGSIHEHQFLAIAPGVTTVTDGRRAYPVHIVTDAKAESPVYNQQPVITHPPSPPSSPSGARTGAATDAAALQDLQAVRQAIVDRELELRSFMEAEMAVKKLHNAGTSDPAEQLRVEVVEVSELQCRVAEADSQAAALEEKLRRLAEPGAGREGAAALEARSQSGGSASEEARSDASTAAPTVQMKDAHLQEKAKALEREIRSEAAAALELQDRIHWLRGQLRRQAAPGSIHDLLAQLQAHAEKLGKPVAGYL
jgi:hypothetical protein